MTDDDIPFIRAILDAPRDMNRRLDYADWLDRFADGRAEAIRNWVALNDPGNSRNPVTWDKGRDQELRGQMKARSQLPWWGLLHFRNPDHRQLVQGSRRSPDADLGYGPCAICGWAQNMPDYVSRMPCERCGRVVCWRCADTGVYGSLPDFQHFVSGSFRRPGFRLGSDSCLFCQERDWMSAHGG